jgi:Flp pilus assembly protein TadG
MNVARARTRPGRLASIRRGALYIEYALALPILLLFVLGAMEIGRYNMITQTANNAAFEAARRCIPPGATPADGQSIGMTVLTAVGIKGGSVAIDPLTISNTTVHVTALVNVPLGKNLWTAPFYFKSVTTITSSCTLTCDWVNSTRFGTPQ